MRTALIVFVAALGVAVGASAQGLGDAAARERAKRKAVPSSTEKRVYDNDDLSKGRPPGTRTDAAADKPAGGAEGAPAPDSPDTAEQSRVQEAEAAVASAEKEVARLEARLQELQERLNPMSVTFVYGQATSGDARAEEQRIKDEIAALPARIADAKRAVVEAQQALADARRPPQG
jgi:peptidoglycan hydrolase CwlO-like protein